MLRNFILFGLILFGIYSCSSTKNTNNLPQKTPSTVTNDTVRIANDSLEYEIIIVEPGFNSWLTTQRPSSYYNLSFLKNKNIFMVTTYNSRVTTGKYNAELYPREINYDPTLEYGQEVNYLLYHYFLYFQEKYNQTL